MATYHIVWKEGREVGMIVADEQLAYELHKGALNPLGIISDKLCEAWAEETTEEGYCNVEVIEL